jgi:cytochrome c biogenesis protein
VVQNKILTSIDPRPLSPQVAIVAYEGYLGLDSGIPQSVYSLDATQIDRGRLTRVGAANLKPGQTMTLKDGTTIGFTGVREFAAMQFSHDPGEYWVLGSAVSMLIGLLGMLLLRRERVFARATGPGADGGTVLSVASLTRGSGESGPRFQALTADLRAALDARVPTTEVASRDT